ncbi:hypothetical protein LQ327_17905 [Actinomycetospora endophytica]|uniref:Uncharacterized protein n=1 Tax=Actinomycetospora endophytica TaxID=2291215 RepID=A0ABS8PAE3_9PSEU|nr:hypothetical protein [Actinomycetospora endophytica]MCD2195246.1 hypothetical protein [Actinomycetospora endophytica]
MSASAAGSLILVLVGVGFLAGAIREWSRRRHDDTPRGRRTTGLVIDLLVGAAAVADGALSVVGEPERVIVWSVGSVALVLAVGLLFVLHHRHPQLS